MKCRRTFINELEPVTRAMRRARAKRRQFSEFCEISSEHGSSVFFLNDANYRKREREDRRGGKRERKR